MQLPGECAPPAGAVLIALAEVQVAGCVLLQSVAEGVAEVRRLYVRPAARGHGIGRALMLALIEHARKAGHTTLRLETLEAMHEAQELYRALGFIGVSPWRPPHTDHDHTLFMTIQV